LLGEGYVSTIDESYLIGCLRGYGAVFKCRNKITSGICAVKVINFEEEALLAIQKEVEILRTVRSESVVGIIGSYLKGSRLFVSVLFLF